MAHNTTAPTSASNSSSAAYSASNGFHIFINHRGCNVKKTMAAHLYRRLTSHGLRVFLDRPELQAGKRILSQIEESIQVASVHIAIFSENYANSKWCLDELRLMVDSEKRGATILPVFYDVKPSDLRWADAAQDGPYAKALRKHEEKGRYDPQRIRGWREALSQVSYIRGFELEACNGDEADLLDKVVERVLTKVPKPVLHVAKYATGLGEKIQDFEKTVSFRQEQQPTESKVVAIAGVGGVGKTTLAKEFFNYKRSGYGGSSFLADVRERASRASLPSLQSQLIKDLKGISRGIDKWEEGIGILETCLSSCHALIIIDDVDDVDQLDAFLPIKGVLHPKSLILVTSRDKHVLRSAGIGKSSIYHLNGLNELHSQELFCSHAFFQPHPRPGFENLVVGFVKSCNGLPLSLKVFGALLCEKHHPYWEEKMKELHRLPDKILASLKISYNSLNQKEQQIFLDIACFALGENRDKWVTIWGGLAGLQTLEDRCLVEVVEEYGAKRMRMHDHLRDMGRNIAEEVSMPRRLWRSIEEVHDLFEEQSLSSVIPDVRGIRMPTGWTSTITENEALLRTKSEIPLNKISSQAAFKMRKLQLLESDGEFVEGILRRVRSPNLEWLCWYNCPCSSLRSWIPMDHLKVLEVEGTKLKKLWRRDSQAPLQLRELYVDAPLLEFPKSIGKLKDLEKIVLRNKFSTRPPEPADLSMLPTLPEEFFHLRSLKYLELSGHLRILPKEFGNLTNLQSIVLSGCERLEKLPDSFTDLTNLQVLQLYGCNSLKRLPKSLGDLTNLQRITLDRCKSLELLPYSFANLTNLQQITLSGCNRLKRLPNSLGDLTNLQGITLNNCEGLEVLPDSFGCLTNLLSIELTGSKRLKKLPDSFTDLKNLQHLMLSGSDRLKRLPKSLGDLTNLQYIYLSGFTSLKKLPNSLGDLINLQRITLRDCEGLEVLPDCFGSLKRLLRIELTGSKRLKKLPDSFTGLTSVQRLNLSRSDRLKRLPKSLGCLTNLQYINLSNCKSLKKLPNSLGDLTNLQEISLEKCESLEILPNYFGNLKNLRWIFLQYSGLKTLPNSFRHLTNLVSIDLAACRSLKMLPNNLFGNLTNLQTVGLSGCESLEKLPHSLGNLTKLRSIQLDNCKSLRKLPKSLGELANLRGIDLSGCKSLKKLPNLLGNLSQLTCLDLSHCSTCSLALPGNITTLRMLELSGCVQMAALPAQVEHQKSLEMLNLLGTNLEELTNAQTACLSNLRYLFLGSPLLKELPPSLGCLSSLKTLLLHGCQELKRLPDSFGLLTQLTELEISKCGIQELPGLMEMNNLQTLRVRGCPLRELPFKELSAPRRKRKRRAKDKGLIGLRELELYCTEVREVSFPEGVSINLQTLRIMCCNDLVNVGSLPKALEHLILRGCGALRKTEGLSGLAELVDVDIRGCYNIQVGELPHFGNSTPCDTYNSEEEEVVEKEMAALQEGVLPDRFAITVIDMKGSALYSSL